MAYDIEQTDFVRQRTALVRRRFLTRQVEVQPVIEFTAHPAEDKGLRCRLPRIEHVAPTAPGEIETLVHPFRKIRFGWDIAHAFVDIYRRLDVNDRGYGEKRGRPGP